MGIIKDYKILDKDLFLTEYLFPTFDAKRQNAVQIWHLINVTERDLDIEKLEELKGNDFIIYDVSVNEATKKHLFRACDDWPDKEIVFECDKIEISQRPYNATELTEIIVRLEKTMQENLDTIVKQKHLIDNLKSNVLRQIETKLKILERVVDQENMGYKKAKIQLDVLRQIEFLLNDANNHKET